MCLARSATLRRGRYGGRQNAELWIYLDLSPDLAVLRCDVSRAGWKVGMGGSLKDMVSTIKEGMGGAKSDYLQNHTFKSPVTRTDTRS